MHSLDSAQVQLLVIVVVVVVVSIVVVQTMPMPTNEQLMSVYRCVKINDKFQLIFIVCSFSIVSPFRLGHSGALEMGKAVRN
jgi:hypothetical protein